MVLILFTQIILDMSWWACKQTSYILYDGMIYMAYGKQPTIDDLHNEILLLKHEIDSLKSPKYIR